jgi:polyhydroxybutyrate depolymerase
MKKFLIIFLLFIASGQIHSQVTVIDSVYFNNTWRNYRLHLPTGFSTQNSLPLVFNFHGYGSNALEQELYTQFDNVADTGNFLVCYPNGLNNAWNILGGQPDDVGFVDTLIYIFSSAYNINPLRVYATGMSNGGFFSNLLACQMSDKIAAIAPVAGSNVTFIQAACNPNRKIPVLYIHGTADSTVFYNGGTGYVSAADLLQFYVTLNGCATSDTTRITNSSTTDGCTADKIVWHGCDSSKRVIHYRINGGGHTWPGSVIDIGVTNRDFNASGVIWNFFNQYSLSIGVDEIPDENISVYPNPFDKTITIDFTEPNFSAMIYSIDGRLLHSFDKLSGKNTIEVDDLTTGYYLLKIATPASTKSMQLLHR